ncbi:MAG TPA: sigma-70 family RNA polymerase sigma factor [Terriglobales bacterium]|nr:sigma-70 family RNA polymerase sigma factor [Terriglobales bacterium]
MLHGWTGRSRRFERDALPHLPAIYRMARQLVGTEAADDLVQETFLRAWKYFESFDSTTNCRAWLFHILRNVWISRWRKSHLELPLADTGEEQIEPYYDWEDEFLRDEMSAEIEHALSDLPADYRLTVLLADVEELTYEEIARVMECPIGTVMSRLNRGRKMLARLIRSYDQERGSSPKPETFMRRKL